MISTSFGFSREEDLKSTKSISSFDKTVQRAEKRLFDLGIRSFALCFLTKQQSSIYFAMFELCQRYFTRTEIYFSDSKAYL